MLCSNFRGKTTFLDRVLVFLGRKLTDDLVVLMRAYMIREMYISVSTNTELLKLNKLVFFGNYFCLVQGEFPSVNCVQLHLCMQENFPFESRFSKSSHSLVGITEE